MRPMGSRAVSSRLRHATYQFSTSLPSRSRSEGARSATMDVSLDQGHGLDLQRARHARARKQRLVNAQGIFAHEGPGRLELSELASKPVVVEAQKLLLGLLGTARRFAAARQKNVARARARVSRRKQAHALALAVYRKLPKELRGRERIHLLPDEIDAMEPSHEPQARRFSEESGDLDPVGKRVPDEAACRRQQRLKLHSLLELPRGKDFPARGAQLLELQKVARESERVAAFERDRDDALGRPKAFALESGV